MVIQQGITSIGDNAFSHCTSLTSITIPNSVTIIGNYAFYNCYSLTSITIPDSVTSIGESAFSWCTSLTSITIPDSVTSIGSWVFAHCTSLSDIHIGNNITQIGRWAFYNTAYYNDEDNWIDGLLYLGVYLLDADENITTADIRSGTKLIAGSAFWSCTSLTSVTIPASVTSIGDSILECRGLKTIQVASGNPSYFSDSSGVLFNNAKTELIRCPSKLEGSYTVPSSVTSIGKEAFFFGEVSDVILPDHLVSIGDEAFYACQIRSIYIPASVTHIGENAFYPCNVMEKIEVAADNPHYSSDSSGVLFNKSKTELIRHPDKDAESYRIPPGVVRIHANAFRGCALPNKVEIPTSVTSIGAEAFADCQKLPDIDLPDSLTYIAPGAFARCIKLKSICIPGGVKRIEPDTFAGCEALQQVELSDGVTSIAENAFSKSFVYEFYKLSIITRDVYCGLTEIKLPESLTTIETGAFADAVNLKSITIPGNVTEINNNTFERCNNLTNVTILDGVASIAFEAFAGCSGLTSVTIPDSVTSIGNNAFYGCNKLESIRIPNGITEIHLETFAGCSNLTSITIPDSVYRIGASAFKDCSRLTSITIPANIYFGDNAFSGCDALSDIYYGGSDQEWDIWVGISEGNEPLLNATIHYASIFAETAPVVKASNDASSGDIQLTWPAIALASRYYVYRAAYKNGPYTRIGFVTGNGAAENISKSWTDETAKPGYTYYYKVVAYGQDDRESAYSNVVSRTADCAKPSLSSSIVSSSGAIKLSWDKVTGASKYYIYRSTDGGKNYSYYTSTTSTSWTNKSVTPGTKYYYKIKAICSNTEGNSAYSNVVYRTADCAKPSLSSSIVSSSGAIKLSWSKVTGAAKYYIYRSTDGGKTYSYYTSTTSTSWTNKSVTPGTKYYYKIKAICANTEGNSAYSNVVYRTADCAKPSLSSSIVSSSGAIKLSWSKVTGATKYYIYRSTDGGTTYKYYTSTTSTSWTNKNVTSGKTYYYKIKAICSNTEGNSAYSNVVSRTADCAKPVVTIQLNGGKPQLKWKAIDGAKEYVIYRATSKSGTYTKMYTTTKLSYTNTGAKSGTTYY